MAKKIKVEKVEEIVDDKYTQEDINMFKSIFGKRSVSETEVQYIKILYRKYVRERINFGECSTCSNNIASAWNELRDIFIIGARERNIDLNLRY